MAAATTDKFLEVGVPGTATNLGGSGYTVGNTSITVTTTTGWPTESLVVFGIDTVETNAEGEEVRVDGSYCIFEGIVTSATTIGSVSKLYGDNQDYAAGATTRVYITISTQQTQKLIDGLMVSHNRDGTLKDGAVDSAAVLAADVVETAKIKDLNVTTGKLADKAVTAGKLDVNAWVAQHTSTVALTTTAASVVTVTVPVVSGATYEVTASYTSATGSSSSGVVFNRLDDSTATFAELYTSRLGTGSQVGATVMGVYTAASTGNITFRLMVATSTATATLNASASGNPVTIIVRRLVVS